MLGVIQFVVFVIFSCSLLPRYIYYIAQLKPYTPFYLISPYQKRGKERNVVDYAIKQMCL